MSNSETPKINAHQEADSQDPYADSKLVKAAYVIAHGINAGIDVAFAPLILSCIVAAGEHPFTGEQFSPKQRVKAAAELAASAIPVKPIRAALKVSGGADMVKRIYKAYREK
jgi:hypothetical protein